MSTIPLNDTTPRVQYTADAGQTVFIFPFWATTANDLSVYVDGALLNASTDFTTSGLLSATGGNITLTTPADDGQIVTIERNIPFERVSEFQEGGTFKASVLNLELSKQLAMMQQLKRDVQRKIGLSPTSGVSVPNLVLPDPVNGKAIVFDGTDGTLRTSVVDVDNLDGAITTATTAATTASAAATTAATAATNASAATTAAEAARDTAMASVGSLKVTAADTTPGPLNSKLAAGQLLFQSTVNPGDDEVLTIGVAIADQATAEAGTSNAAAMTPLNTQQHLEAKGGWQYVTEATFSDAVNVDFTTLDTENYEYDFTLGSLTVATDNTRPHVLLSDNGGSSFDNALNYDYDFWASQATFGQSAGMATEVGLGRSGGTDGLGNAAGENMVGNLRLRKAVPGAPFKCVAQTEYTTSAGHSYSWVNRVSNNNIQVPDAVRFALSFGVISGTITVYRRKI